MIKQTLHHLDFRIDNTVTYPVEVKYQWVSSQILISFQKTNYPSNYVSWLNRSSYLLEGGSIVEILSVV